MKTKILAFCAAILVLCSMSIPAFAADFTDVSDDAWYCKAVDYVSENGLMTGTGGGEFSPAALMDRAMFVTVLYRMEGTPSVSANNRFSDVAPDSYYVDAVTWAAEAGIAKGNGDGQFAPNAPLSRQQLATMLYRYAEYKGYSIEAYSDFEAFSDSREISGYAQTPLHWAVGAGIITGSNGKILPKNNATRAQTAAMLMRFDQNIVKPSTSESPDTSNQPTEQRRMRITVGDTVLYAKLADNETADAIAEKLPLTLNMMDLYGREMCYRFEEELPATDVQTRNFELGEIIYWPPRHSFVIMYHQDGEVFSMQHVGQIESGVEIFDTTGDVTVTFELMD